MLKLNIISSMSGVNEQCLNFFFYPIFIHSVKCKVMKSFRQIFKKWLQQSSLTYLSTHFSGSDGSFIRRPLKASEEKREALTGKKLL